MTTSGIFRHARAVALGSLFLAVFSLCAACDDDDPAGTTDGGALADASGGSGGGATLTSCSAPAPTVVVANVNGVSLAAVGEDFVYVDVGAGGAQTAIRRVGGDGTAGVTLHTHAAKHVITELLVSATDIVFVDDDYGPSVPVSRIMKMPLTGGAPVQLGGDLSDARLVGLDAASAYTISRAAERHRFSRLPLGGGTVTTIADVPGATPGGATLAGAKLYFTQLVPMMRGVFGYQILDVSGASATPAPLGVLNSATCLVALQPVVFGTTALICTSGPGGNLVIALDLDGINPRTLLEGAVDGPHYNALAAAGDSFYLQRLPSKANMLDGAVLKMNLATPAALTPIACNRGTVKQRLFRKTIPVLDAVEIAVGPTRIAWIEQRIEAGALTFTLFSQPR